MKKIFSVFVLFLFVFGCSEALQEEMDQNPELKSGKMVERPFIIHSSTGTMGFLVSDECPDLGPGVPNRFVVNGSGNATHLGKFTVKNFMCLDGSPIQGELTAANGDKIFTMVTKEPWMEDGVIHYYYSILDGTGRFEDAGGYVVMFGVIDYATMTFDLKGDGRIIF